jgi:hypothetical protein
MRLGPSTFDDTVQRLPGLTVQIGETCKGCGLCAALRPYRLSDAQSTRKQQHQEHEGEIS